MRGCEKSSRRRVYPVLSAYRRVWGVNPAVMCLAGVWPVSGRCLVGGFGTGVGVSDGGVSGVWQVGWQNEAG